MLRSANAHAPGRFSQYELRPQRYIRSVSVNLEGVDAVLGQASCLQKWTVVTQLHTLAGEVVGLEQLQPVVFSVLGRKMACMLAES